MRFIKLLGFAAIAALAAMAFVGASTASADVACKENVGHKNECPANKIVIENHFVKGKTEGNPAKFLVNGVTELSCESEILGQVKANIGPHKGLLILVTKLLFSSCKGLCKKAEGHSLPWLLLIEALDLHAFLSQHPDGGLQPAALFKECTTFNISCLYELVSDAALLGIENDLLISDRSPMLRSGHSAFCPKSGEFDAKYRLWLDSATNLTGVWPTALP